MRKIGKRQQDVLEALEQHKGWNPGCGWIWDNYSTTVSILKSLVKAGLVTESKMFPGSYSLKKGE